MSAMTSTSAFAGQLAFTASPARRSCPAAHRRMQISCAVPAHSQAQQGANPVKLLVAGFAAAAFMHGAMPAPAQAGVIMVKTGTKKVFQDDAAAGTPEAAKVEVKPATPVYSTPALTFTPAFLALPGAVGGIAVIGLAVSKLDAGFGEFFADTIVKNSNRDGFGYETYKTNGVPTGRPGGKKSAKKTVSSKKGAAPAAKGGFAFPSFGRK